MSDSVKFIFKTLIKVPCIIFAAYFIMNVFFFFFIYFKVLGLSYVVMQEVVENNYITTSQFNQLNAYIQSINNIEMVNNTSIIVGLDSAKNPVYCTTQANGQMIKSSYSATLDESNAKSALTRVNYGQNRVVGIHCDYTLIWPLDYNQTHPETKANGVDGNSKANSSFNTIMTQYNYNGPEDADDGKVDNKISVTIPLNIYYNVPGLKYYAR